MLNRQTGIQLNFKILHLRKSKSLQLNIDMKNLTFTLCFLGCALLALNPVDGQDLEFADLDVSSLDMAHYPPRAAFNNYLDEKEDLQIKVLYSRPKKKEREIFGGLVPYGKVWRLGANEGTEITFYSAAMIGGVTVNPGTYTIRAMINPNHWDVVLSTQRHVAGVANMDSDQEFVHATAEVSQVAKSNESFTIGFQRVDDESCNMVFAWDQTVATLPISFNPPAMRGDDASPLDMVQYPSSSRFQNFLKEEDLAANVPQVRVVYSRPQKKGRKIFGDLVKYGETWRLGANETTEITFFDDVTVGDKEIKKGTYGLFAKVNEDSWEYIIHKNLPSWGAANHDESTNVASFTAKVEAAPKTMESLSMTFHKANDGEVHLVTCWDNVMTKLPIMVGEQETYAAPRGEGNE